MLLNKTITVPSLKIKDGENLQLHQIISMITIYSKTNSFVFILIIGLKIIWFHNNWYKNIHNQNLRVIIILGGKHFMWVTNTKRIDNKLMS